MKRGRSSRRTIDSDDDTPASSQGSSQRASQRGGSSQRGRGRGGSQGPPKKIARRAPAAIESDSSDSSSDEQPSQPASSQRGRGRGGSSQASQRGGASQRGRRKTQEDEEEFTQRPVGKSNLQQVNEEERETLVNALVRYCLLVDAQKHPIKRVELTKHVLGEGYKKSKILSALIDVAQDRLRATFGMELVQIPKMVTEKDGHTVKKEASGIYILRSTLEKTALAELVGDYLTPTQRAQRNLLMIVLALIELNQGSFEQVELIKRISKLDLPGVQHNDPDLLGSDWPEKLIKGAFVSQLYVLASSSLIDLFS